MRERILRRVVLPAPLRPMRPRTSPSLTSRETSFKAQNFSPFRRPKTESGDFKVLSKAWRNPSSASALRRYSLPRPSPRITAEFIGAHLQELEDTGRFVLGVEMHSGRDS